jgi:hypothetical protein
MNEHLSISPLAGPPADLVADMHRWALAGLPTEFAPSDSPSAPEAEAPEAQPPATDENAFSGSPSEGIFPEPLTDATPQVLLAETPRTSVPAALGASDRTEVLASPESETPSTVTPATAPEAPALVSKVASRRRFWPLPVVCVLATLAGGALATKIGDYGHAAPMANLAAEVNGVRAEQEQARAELEKQSASLAATREALRSVTERQKEDEEAAKVEYARVENEQARLARDVAATKHAQSRTDEHVYQLSEALKLIDWATMGGTAGGSLQKSASR